MISFEFEQLIIHDTKLIPPNTQHEFFSMNIRLGCQWSMASPWFSLLWVIVVDPFFITSDYTMQKILSFMASSISHVKNRRSTFLGFSSYGTQFPWIIPNDFKRYEICWVTPNVSASSFCIWHESSSNNASNSASSYTFGLPLCSLSSTSNSPFLNFWNHSRQLLSLKAASPYASTSLI